MSQVLIVDDHRVNTRLTSRILRMAGHSDIHTCNTGSEAMQFIIAEGNTLGLVITDWNMPFLRGMDVCKLAIALDIPTIVLTGEYRPQERYRAEALGVSAYLTKPTDRVQLTEAIDRVLAEHGERQQNHPKLGYGWNIQVGQYL